MLLAAFVYLGLIATFVAYCYRSQLAEEDAYKWLICVVALTGAVTFLGKIWLLYLVVFAIAWFVIPKTPE